MERCGPRSWGARRPARLQTRLRPAVRPL